MSNNDPDNQDNTQTQNDQYNLQILHKYLTLQLIKDLNYPKNSAKLKASELIKNSSNLWGKSGLAHNLQKKSFTFFNLYYLQDLLVNGSDKYKLSPSHYEIWQELEDSILIKKYPERVYACPRGYGKTSTISIPLVIWCSINSFKNYTVLASAVALTAEQFLASIKTHIKDNQFIIKSFGQLIDTTKYKVNSEKIQLTNKCAIESISASGAIRGKQNELTSRRIELLICDDYQTSEQTKTHEQRENKFRTFNADAKKAMQKDNQTIICLGTVQHAECFYSRLIDDPIWKSRIEKAVLMTKDKIDELFSNGLWKEFHTLLVNKKDPNSLDTATEFYLQNFDSMQFPLLWDYWKCFDFAKEYLSDKSTFFQECQNDVTGLGEKKFKTIRTESALEIETHNFLKTVLVVDPAGTRTKVKGNKKDFFGFAVCSVSDTNLKYIRKGEIFKFTQNREYEDYIEHTIKLLKEYPVNCLAIEKNTFGGADSIEIQKLIDADPILAYRDIEIISFTQNKNKDDKINTYLVGKVNLGQVIFNEDDQEAIQQLKDFCGVKFSAFDDFPDVCAEAIRIVEEIEVYEPAQVLNISRLYRK